MRLSLPSSVAGRALAAFVLIVGTAAPAFAQTTFAEAADQTRPARPAARRPVHRTIGVRVYATFDENSLLASKTFDAVLGKHQLQAPGVGGEVLRVWKGLFLRAAISNMRETGSRVAIADTQAESLDIPLTVQMRPLELGAGWRFESRRHPRVVPYVGAGLIRLKYRETSDFADSGEDTDTWYRGSVWFAGADVGLWRMVMAGVEGQYRTLPDALGGGGASKVFDETDLGGATLRVLVGIRY